MVATYCAIPGWRLSLCWRKPHLCRPYFQQLLIFWEEMKTHIIFPSLITTCHYIPIWHVDECCLKLNEIKEWSSSRNQYNQYSTSSTNHWSISWERSQLTSHTSHVTWLRGRCNDLFRGRGLGPCKPGKQIRIKCYRKRFKMWYAY